MNLSIEPSRNWISSTSTKSDSSSSGSATAINQWTRQLEQHLWRAIDFLHIVVMFFSLYTGIIVAILRNELFEQCPLYAELYLVANATQFSTETIDRETTWGSVYTCEFASFAYLSSFVVSFVSLWIHIVFRRVLRTERLLRLPIGIVIVIFTLIDILATSIVTDGVIKFCLKSPKNLCTSSGPIIFNKSRWKIISLPVGGWLTTVSILLTAIARGFQLLSKPKKSPQTLKALINQVMANKIQQKIEKETSDYGSQISRISKTKNRSQPPLNRSTDHTSNREFFSELYPYYYPPVPQYRQIEKRSRFQRICCPCFRRQRRQRSYHEPYRPFIIPDEYYRRLDHLKQNETIPGNVCHHQHHHPSINHPIEQETQTDLTLQQKKNDEINETPYLGRRRSSVRFEDERDLIKTSNQPTTSSKLELIPIIKEKKEDDKEKEKKPTSSIVEKQEDNNNNDLQRNVSFRNNEDDLWTTITINTDRSTPIQSSHYNRLVLENLSVIDTSITNNDNGVTAIHINSRSIESPLSENVEKEIQSSSSPPPAPPPPPPPPPPIPSCSSSKTTRHRHKPPPPPPSRSYTASSEDDTVVRHIKPVEEINTTVTDKYNYNDLSQALKSNVKRLKSTFIDAQEKQFSHDKSMNIRSTLSKNQSSDC